MEVSADRVGNGQGQMRAADSLQSQEPEPTILVVDDNETVLEFLLLLLSKHGLPVIGTSSGSECLKIVASRVVDLIILDVMMPAMDGLEVCRHLKKVNGAVPIILLTARDDMRTRAAAMDLGVSEFVAKPVNNQDLLHRIRMQLRNLQWRKTRASILKNPKISMRYCGRQAIAMP